MLSKNIDSVLFALRHVDTYEAFTTLFKAFLNVNIEPTILSPGIIDIKLKNHIKTNFNIFIVDTMIIITI